MSLISRTGLLLGTILAAAGVAGTASAHPHVWVAVRSEVVFAPDGKITSVRHSWTFDEMYSAFAITGLGKGGKSLQEELNELAKVNVKQLEEYNYFTTVRAGGKKAEFAPVKDATISLDAKQNVTLNFTVEMKEPASAARAFFLQVFDPDYFVAFDFEKQTPVTMKNAPQGCSLRMVTPKPLTDEDMKKLQDSAGTNNSPGADFGLKLATRASIACP